MIRSLYAELALESLSLARSGFFPPLDGRVSYLKDDFLTIPAIRPITHGFHFAQLRPCVVYFWHFWYAGNESHPI